MGVGIASHYVDREFIVISKQKPYDFAPHNDTHANHISVTYTHIKIILRKPFIFERGGVHISF